MTGTKKKNSRVDYNYKILLAKEVEKYNIIWDTRAKKDKQALEDAWKQVQLALHEKNVDSKREWQLLKKSYRWSLSNRKTDYHPGLKNAMAFLKPQMLKKIDDYENKKSNQRESNTTKKQGNPSTSDQDNDKAVIVQRESNTTEKQGNPSMSDQDKDKGVILQKESNTTEKQGNPSTSDQDNIIKLYDSDYDQDNDKEVFVQRESNTTEKQENPSTSDQDKDKEVILATVNLLLNNMRPEDASETRTLKMTMLNRLEMRIPRLRSDIIKHAKEQVSEHNKDFHTIDWSGLRVPQIICQAVLKQHLASKM